MIYTFEANSRVINRFLNEGYKLVKGVEEPRFEEASLLLETLYVSPWETWLSLLKFIPLFKIKDLEETFQGLKSSIAEFTSEPSEERFVNLYSSYISWLERWNSFEGELRKAFRETLEIPPDVSVPKKYWELLVLVLIFETLHYQYEQFKRENLRELLGKLWSFRKTYPIYFDLSVAQFFTYPEEHRDTFSAYFKLMNALESLLPKEEVNQVPLDLLIKSDVNPSPYQERLSAELSLADTLSQEDVSDELISNFWKELSASRMGNLIVELNRYHESFASDLNYRAFSSFYWLLDILPNYLFVVENVRVPEGDLELMRANLRLSLSLTRDYLNGLLLGKDLEERREVILRALERYEETLLNLEDEITEDYREALRELSDAIFRFSEAYASYKRELDESKKYLSYLSDLVLKANLLYLPTYTLVIEAGRMRVAIPWEDEEERIKNIIPVFYPLSEDEKNNYLEALDSFLEFASALEDFALTEDTSHLMDAWRNLYSKFSFLDKLRESVMRKYEEFEKEVSALFKGLGHEKVKSPLTKLLGYIKLKLREATSDEDKEKVLEIADRAALVIEESLKNLEENLPEELPEEFSSFDEVINLSDELLNNLISFIEEGNEEALDSAIEISLKLEPVLSQLQVELTRSFTNLYKMGAASQPSEGGS